MRWLLPLAALVALSPMLFDQAKSREITLRLGAHSLSSLRIDCQSAAAERSGAVWHFSQAKHESVTHRLMSSSPEIACDIHIVSGSGRQDALRRELHFDSDRIVVPLELTANKLLADD